MRTRCWTYTVLDVHKKCTSNTMISQFPETTEVILHDVYIAYNKCTLHHRWYILSCFRLMRIWKNVCSWCWTYITKVVKLAKTAMEKTYNMNFPFTYHCKLYLLTLEKRYNCYRYLLLSWAYKRKIHFCKFFTPKWHKICHWLHYVSFLNSSRSSKINLFSWKYGSLGLIWCLIRKDLTILKFWPWGLLFYGIALLLKWQYCEICLIFVLPLCASLMHVKCLFPFWQKTFFCMKMYDFAMV